VETGPSKRSPALILGIAAIAVLAWLTLDSGGSEARPGAGAESAQDSLPATVRRAELPAATSEVPRAALAQEPEPELGAGYEFLLHVVRDLDGASQTGVELRTSPSATRWNARSQDYALRPGEDFADMLARAGALHHSDANGEARIAHDGQDLFVLARQGRSFAFEHLHIDGPKRSQSFTIRLEEDAALVFLMLDEHDAPVEGVTLSMTGVVTETDRASTPRVMHTRGADRDGRIVFPHAQSLRHDDGLAAAECDVRPNLSGVLGEPVRVALEPLPEGPVLVRVPPWSALEVSVLGPDGEPWPFPEGRATALTVLPVLDDAPPLRNPVAGRSHGVSQVGIARVAPLRAGRRYALSLFELRIPRYAVQAPERLGEVLRVELRVPTALPIVRGRLLDESGLPHTGACLLDFAGKRESGELEIGCGVDGRFRAVLPDGLVDDAVELGVTVRAAPPARPIPLTTARSVRALSAGFNELGELRLAEMHVLAEGRVEWEDGEPASNAGVGIETERTGGGWSASRTGHTTSDARGRFRLMGAPDGRAHRLKVAHRDAVACKPIALVPGAPGLVVRLQRGASLEASLLADPSLPLRELGFDLQWRGSEPDPREDGQTHGERQGSRIRWSRLPAGRYALAIRTGGTSATVAVIDDLEVAAGKPCEDPRTQDIDLRGRVHRCELRVSDGEGRALMAESVRAERIDAQGRRTPVGRQLQNGTLEIALVEPCDVVVSVDGFQRATARAVPGPVDLQLRRAPALRLRCAAELPGEVEFWVKLRPIAPEAASATTGAGEVTNLNLTARREAIWSPMEDQVVDVEAILRRGVKTQRVTLLAPLRLDSTALDPARAIEIELDPQSLTEALASLGNR
jgi:hypothetical protein